MRMISYFTAIIGTALFLAGPAQAQVKCASPDYKCLKWRSGVSTGGIKLAKYCESYAGRQNCTDAKPQNQCAALQASNKCDQLTEKCISHKNGQCVQWRHEFTCFNENNDMSPATLTSTTFGIPREWFENTCEDLENDGRCELAQTIDKEGAETRDINRKDFHRAWWQKERTYSCRVPGEGANNCAPLESDPTCVLKSNTCLAEEGGVCSNRQYHYRCGVHSGELETSCKPVNVCVGEFCIGAEEEPSTSFGDAAAWLNIMHEMQKEYSEHGGDPNAVKFFQGELKSCTKQPGRDCCGTGGIIDDTFNQCSEEAQNVRDAFLAGSTHFVGPTCDIKVAGSCWKQRYHFCTYKSKFARVFIEQVKIQLEEEWGYALFADCRYITINELASLDMDQMDFSEVFDDILAEAAIPVSADIQDFYEQRFPNTGAEAEQMFEELEE